MFSKRYISTWHQYNRNSYKQCHLPYQTYSARIVRISDSRAFLLRIKDIMYCVVARFIGFQSIQFKERDVLLEKLHNYSAYIRRTYQLHCYRISDYKLLNSKTRVTRVQQVQPVPCSFRQFISVARNVLYSELCIHMETYINVRVYRIFSIW